MSRLLAVTAVSCGPASSTPESQLKLRERMVSDQIESRGVHDALVLAALRKVPRHLFVPHDLADHAYADSPLAIGNGQTISQPYIVGFMTAALRLRGGESVLEVGTGSGYQSAVLAEIAGKVHSIEIIEALGRVARERLETLGYKNVTVRIGDGYKGWPEEAPFDGIIVTAAAPRIPDALKEQLRDGGRLVIPIGEGEQELILVTRRGTTYEEQSILPVRFVPMTGQVRK